MTPDGPPQGPQEPAAAPRLSVAGMRIVFAAAPGLRLTAPGGVYTAFRDCPGATACVTVRVDIHRPDYRPAGRCLFDTGNAWRLWADGDTRTVEFTERARGGAPQWRVSWRAPLTRGEASVARDLVAGGRIDHLVQYPLDQILLTEALYAHGRVLLHAAGGDGPGGGVAFCGPSGAGKSTVTRLLGARPGYRFLSDDRLFVDLPHTGREQLRLHGTPWPGDAVVARAESTALDALCFLEHAPVTRLSALSPRAALERLLPVVTLPWFDRERIGDLIERCARLVSARPCYRLAFRPDADALARALAPLHRAA